MGYETFEYLEVWKPGRDIRTNYSQLANSLPK